MVTEEGAEGGCKTDIHNNAGRCEGEGRQNKRRKREGEEGGLTPPCDWRGRDQRDCQTQSGHSEDGGSISTNDTTQHQLIPRVEQLKLWHYIEQRDCVPNICMKTPLHDCHHSLSTNIALIEDSCILPSTSLHCPYCNVLLTCKTTEIKIFTLMFDHPPIVRYIEIENTVR